MTTDSVGGVWTYALELTRALAPHGVDVVLATMGAPLTASHRGELRELRNVDLHESRYRLEWMPDAWPDVARAGEWLRTIEDHERADVVHLNGYVHGALQWRAPVVVVGHSCVLSWHAAVRGESAPNEWDEYARRVADGLAAADLVVAPTRAMLDALLRHYGSPRRSCVVPNGSTAPARTPGRKEAFILSAGRLWDEAKNVRALARIARRLPWPVYVAGDIASPSAWPTAIPELEDVITLGRLSRGLVVEWMARASIYALPARYEPFGLSVLEAALARCALLLSDIPSLRELWDGAALFVPPDDDDALIDAVYRLAYDDALRCALVTRAHERALTMSAEVMASSYLSLYHTLERRMPRASTPAVMPGKPANGECRECES